jgi:hypothetical protein
MAEAELHALRSNSLVERAIDAIETIITLGEPVDCRGVAKRLGTSARTLQRRLRELDVSFLDLRDRARARIVTKVAGGLRPPGSMLLTDALGYSEPSATYRALKRLRASSAGGRRVARA